MKKRKEIKEYEVFRSVVESRGLSVDEVDQVMRISTSDIDLQSDSSGFSQNMRGIAKVNDRLIIILDLPKILEDINTGE